MDLYQSRIAGTGSYLPAKELTNLDLEKMVATDNQWIKERTGIYSRHIAAPGEITSDLALQASLKALEAAQLEAKDIDFILVATISPDQIMPSTACVLQNKLKISKCGALDISAACSGFVYGLSIANQFIATGVYRNVLVVGAEILHNYVNYKDRETCILFGDGAGAAILSRSEKQETSKIYSHHLHASGEYGDLFVLPIGGSALPFTKEVLDSDSQYVKMKGREIFKVAVRTMSESCREALEQNNLAIEDISWVIPHQANIRIIDAVGKMLQLPPSKMVVAIENMGNTSAATVPVSLDIAIRDGRIKRDQNVLLTAFGAGVTSGSLLFKY